MTYSPNYTAYAHALGMTPAEHAQVRERGWIMAYMAWIRTELEAFRDAHHLATSASVDAASFADYLTAKHVEVRA